MIGRFILAAIFFATAWIAAAQDEQQYLMPDQSAAKAKEIIQQGIDALGGTAYLNVHEVACTGHIAEFDSDAPGTPVGYVEINDFRAFPYKARIEYVGKGEHNILQYVTGIEGLEFTHGGLVITLYNGDHGWTYDRTGVNELPADAVAEFHDQVNKNIDDLLRVRLKEPGMTSRYGGSDIIDGWQADWVELVDKDDHTIRIAFSRSTHLPIRETLEIIDPNIHMKSSETFYFSNYHVSGGVQTPLQILRERNGRKLSQTFFDKCENNANSSDSLFTKESLDQRWAQSGRKDKKDKKDKD